MKAVVASSRFQPGEGPSRGLLRDYDPSDGPSFKAIVTSQINDVGRAPWPGHLAARTAFLLHNYPIPLSGVREKCIVAQIRGLRWSHSIFN